MSVKEREELIAGKVKEFHDSIENNINEFLDDNPNLSYTFVFCLSHQHEGGIEYATASSLGAGSDVNKPEMISRGPYYITSLVDGVGKLSTLLRKLSRRDQDEYENMEEHP